MEHQHKIANPVLVAALQSEVGYVDGRPPRERAFKRELDAELARMEAFLRPT